MRRCGAKPYEGSENFIFISYCHKDKAAVFPVAERLARDGYRVWYDEGIDPGAEWPEIIAEHLSRCSACIAFVSENALNSHNCRREINFALLKKKPFISVVTEEVKMSPGMEMQLSSAQSIFRYTLGSDAEFFEKLYAAECLKCCLGTPDPDIRVSSPEDLMKGDPGLFSEEEDPRGTFSDKWFVNSGAPLPKENSDPASPGKEPANGGSSFSAPFSPEKDPPPADADFDPKRAWLVRVKTGDRINITLSEFKLGRSDTRCDYAISGNGAIGRFHAVISFCDKVYYITDKYSMNKTYLNSRELIPEERYKLSDKDQIRLANELFIFYLEK